MQPDPAASTLLDEVISVHGGSNRWDALDEVVVRAGAGGLAFASRGQTKPIREAEARVATQGQAVVLTPYPARGTRGVFEAAGVRIEGADGRAVTERTHGGVAFRDLRQLSSWDALDMLHVVASLLWTHVSIPFVLARRGYGVRHAGEWVEDGEQWDRLAVTFPASIKMHAREHILYVDGDRHIRRVDYSSDALGKWSRVAHYCQDYGEFSGLALPTRHRVFPRAGDGTATRDVQLVFLDLTPMTA